MLPTNVATRHEESPEHEVITRSREIKYVSVIQILKIIISNTTEDFYVSKNDFHTRETFLYYYNNNNKRVFLMKRGNLRRKVSKMGFSSNDCVLVIKN